MATIPIATTPVPNTPSATTSNQSVLSSSAEVSVAASNDRKWHRIYVGFLIFAGLGTAYLTVKTSDTGNRLQDALKRGTETKLERERGERTKIEKALAPRLLIRSSNSQTGQTSFDSLKPFEGTSVIIRFVETKDDEPQRAAGNIAAIVSAAGWRVVKIEKADWKAISAGVRIDTYSELDEGKNTGQWIQEGPSFTAGKALLEFLTEKNWQANLFADVGQPERLDKNEIRVLVGKKPEWQFIPKAQWEKDFEEQWKKMFGTEPPHPGF